MSATSGTVQSSGAQVLELSLADKRQIFNSMDPAPFRERDLDPAADDYIVAWAREQPAGRLALEVHLSGGEPATAAETAILVDAVHEHFCRRALGSRRQLRQLFRTGRISLVIGLVFLGAAITAGEFLTSLISKEGYGGLLKESLVIGGWVALWRPMEIFLYEWWPIRADIKLFERLGAMDVRLRGIGEAR